MGLTYVNAQTVAQDAIPDQMEKIVRELSPLIHRQYGDIIRLNKKQRKELGLFKNARWYNKRFRFLKRLEDKISRQLINDKRNMLRIVSKTSVSSFLKPDDLSDKNTISFIAYYTARKGVRSVFTNKSQDRAYDEISNMLLNKCVENTDTTNWLAIGHIFPDKNVLDKINDNDKGKLIATYWSVIEVAASILENAWAKMPGVEKDKMIVKRGSDSSTWNEAAGAWNQARESWIKLLQSMEMYDLIESLLPGKVMRVMAADVARWHQASGGDVHPDTKVWAKLPFPWDVVHGNEKCTVDDIEKACKNCKVKIDGWLGNYNNKRNITKFKPTPELVHGVEISSPGLAMILRKAGIFSSQGIKDMPYVGFFVERDGHGNAIKVH